MRRFVLAGAGVFLACALAHSQMLMLNYGAGGFGTILGWDPANIGTTIALSNSNLTAVDGPQWMGMAIDFTHSKVWWWNPQTAQWNGAAIGSQNPATNTGGEAFTVPGTLFPMFSGFFASSAADTAIANFGATTFNNTIPSGFSSWNALTAATVTWNASDKSTGITLSNGNLTAATSSGVAAGNWRSVRATNGLSAGLAYFEINTSAVDASSGFIFGAGNSTAPLTSYAGNTTDSMGWQIQGSVYQLTGSPGTYQLTGNAWRYVISKQSHASGKRYFEISASAFDGAAAMIGVTQSTGTYTGHFCGDGTASGTGGSLQATTGFVWFNNAHLATGVGPWNTGEVEGVAVDMTNNKIWFYDPVQAKWNGDVIGNQNPATNTGGYASIVSGTNYACLSYDDFRALSSTVVNFGNSAFSNSIPSGFSAWNVP
jgi:hypothetical protein